MMKAILWTNYGSPDVLQFGEVAKPTPSDNEVLIRIYATTVTAGDCELRSFRFPFFLWLPLRLYLGLRKPRKTILGQDLAGEIEAVGKDVKRFKKGDQVCAATGLALGAYAEYTCLPEKSDGGMLALKPTTMTYDEAAPVLTWGLVALYFLRKANIRPGQKVLINGAAGSIGTYAIQLAKHFGAEVTGVESTNKLELLHSLGADHVIDYTQDDFTKNGEIYDVIFDVVGKSSFSGSVNSLKPDGLYLLANPGLSHIFRGLWLSMTSRKKAVFASSGEQTDDLRFLNELIEAGTIKTVIDKRYPLEHTAEAHRYVDKNLKQGNVIITLGHLTSKDSTAQ